jgi:acetyl esterase
VTSRTSLTSRIPDLIPSSRVLRFPTLGLLAGLGLLALLPARLAAADWTVPVGETQVYKQTSEGPLTLAIVRPDSWKPSDRRPAIVFFHGGGWVGGPAGQFNEHSAYFASRGLVCIQVRYRFVPVKTTVPPVVCIQDARSALRWVRSHARELGIDPQRIAGAGASAGGHLAAHAGLVSGTDDPADDVAISPRPAALLLFNPVLDNSPGNYGTERMGDRLEELSPAQNVSKDDPPAIVFLGTKDKLIPVKTMEDFRARMTAAGVRCDLHLYAGEDHGFFNSKNQDGKYYSLTVRAADEFLRSLGWLEGAPTLPALAAVP